MRVLITGITGFAGSHLADELLAAGYDVCGTRMRGESSENLTGCKQRVKVRVLDLCSPNSCARILDWSRPEAIFHLAAFTNVGASFVDPDAAMRVNYAGTLNLFEAIRNSKGVKKPLRVFLLLGSSDMYGRVRPAELPLDETQPLRPVSPYAISKAAADFLGATYHRAYKLPIIRIRSFNHAGPRQRTGFVVPDFAAQIARLERRSGRRILRTGDLSARRDLTDVRDVVRAYRLIAEQGDAGEVYHVGSGKTVTIQGIVDKLLGLARRSITTAIDPKRMRPAEVPILRADITKLKKLGWEPTISLKQTLADTLDYYRSRR